MSGNRGVGLPDLGTPPETYNRSYMLTTVRQIVQFMNSQRTPGHRVEGRLSLIDCPTNGGGLRVGDMWVDGNGFLKLVMARDALVSSIAMPMKIGKVKAA